MNEPKDMKKTIDQQRRDMTPKANSSIMRSLMSSDAYTKKKKYQPQEKKE